jgi:hypothetical protein
MKNISTGFGLALLAGSILAYPFVSSLAPSANASAVIAAASAVSTAATAQTSPTIVWYGMCETSAYPGYSTTALTRAWSDGKVEAKFFNPYFSGGNPASTPCSAFVVQHCSGWFVISDPAQGLTYRSDINFDEKVDGADLGQLLSDWGDAPRQDIPPSDCPLNLVNP